MIRSEIVRKLICCAFDCLTPEELDLPLYSCLDLYAELRIEEGRQPTLDDLITRTQHGAGAGGDG